MPITNPGKGRYRPGLFRREPVEKHVLMNSIPLLFVRRKVLGGGHKSVNADLNLTSMIDYLVITVVFLLSNFGSQQQVQSSANLELPEIPHSSSRIASAPIVSITDSLIMLDGQRITTPREIAGVTDRIDRLFERLESARREFPVVHPGATFEGDIVFQIDRRVSWQVIKTVAKTCALAGYTRLNFAVTRGTPAASTGNP
ncbi:MAG: biopolymer transporter ExbD [Deltaproteobacteria bacterium]|nr:biopolymer transporter ExbD [Deltaproteobacteria bacterium]